MSSKTSEVIKLENVRLSYPKLFTPKSFEEGQPKRFEAAFILDPSNPDHAAKIKEIKIAARNLMVEAFGENFAPKDLRGVCFGDGDKKDKTPDGYAGMFYLNSANTTRPAVANRRGEPVAEGDPQTPYGGCYVNATITLWAQNNRFGKRINGNLRGVQFVKDGEAFGQAPASAESEFDALEDNSPVASGKASEDWDDDIPF